MSKGDSKADKTGGHKSTGQKTPSYSKAPAAAPAQGLGTAGAKALMFRARKILAPDATPEPLPTVSE